MSGKTEYMREYMKKRREDPAFKQKQKEYQRKYVEKQRAILQAVKEEDVEKPVDSKMVFIKMLLSCDLSDDVKAQVLYEIGKTD
jgi:hypothetical protein